MVVVAWLLLIDFDDAKASSNAPLLILMNLLIVDVSRLLLNGC